MKPQKPGEPHPSLLSAPPKPELPSPHSHPHLGLDPQDSGMEMGTGLEPSRVTLRVVVGLRLGVSSLPPSLWGLEGQGW